MWTSKKAVSPLIAAVLLIVVVVGVGAVVTGIVRNYVTSGKQTIQSKSGDIKCGAEVDISVPTVANAIRICKDGDLINFTLDNSGSTLIDGLQLKVFSPTGVNSTDDFTSGAGLGIGQTAVYSVAIPTGWGATLQEVQIVPRIQVVGRAELAYCTDSALKFTPQDC